MSDSILEKVIHHRDTAEKQAFDITAVVQSVLNLLTQKESQVLIKRFGLSGNPKQTLEIIGNELQVTRERIRQIERQAITNIKENDAFKEIMKPVEHVVLSVVHQHGGVMTMDMLAEELLTHQHANLEHRAALHFVLSQLLSDKIEHVRTHKAFEPSWKMHVASEDLIESAVKVLTEILTKLEQPQPFETVANEFRKTDLYGTHADHFTDPVITSYLHVSNAIGKNAFDEYGLAHWGQINPKRMHDRVYIILKKEGKPLHFEDIATRITEVFGKKAYPPTVHNELILNDEYVLVGRGLYALKEWGYQEGVVSDIIDTVLNDNENALTRDEIVENVLKQRMVKKNTVHLALTNTNRFTKQEDGRYSKK